MEATQDYPVGGMVEPYDIDREKKLVEEMECDHYCISDCRKEGCWNNGCFCGDEWHKGVVDEGS